MRLTDATVTIRPRSAWESIDLGVLMARRQRLLLMANWAVISLPVFLLLTVLLWQHPSWAMLAFWWLKPLFERGSLFILSRSLFNATPTLQESIKAWPSLLRPQLISSLLWRRLSPIRSFSLPVQQLEGLSGATRRQRLAVLTLRDSSAATGLTLLGSACETVIYLGLLGLLYSFIPGIWQEQMIWSKLLDANTPTWLWFEHLCNLLYALVMLFWGPIYTACGFSLYLNRRSTLEAWDIELVFRSLRQRLTGSAYALLLGAVLISAWPAEPTWAATAPPTTPTTTEAPRLLNQALNSQQAQADIEQILQNPPFVHNEVVTRWRLGPEKAAQEDSSAFDLQWLFKFLENILNLHQLADSFTLGLKGILWALVIILVVIVLYRYRAWLQTFTQRLGLPQRTRREQPSQLFGLDLSPESLPQDVASQAERLWSTAPRQALSLLYRALLSRLLHTYQLPLKKSHTEGEVLHLISALADRSLIDYSQQLTEHWQQLAYAHQLPDSSTIDQLCQGWRQQFDGVTP